jgi:hypothetical protein
MPVKLGMTAVGAASSALGGSGKAGPSISQKQVTSTNTGSNTSNTSQTGTSTPNLNPLMAGFQSSLVPALSSMYGEAQQPVYGAQQIAQVANNGDAATDAASNSLSANLARRGVLNSGAQAAGQTALQSANTANTVNFENQVPLLNYQNEMQQTGNVLGLAEGLTGKALSSNTTSGTGSGVQTNSSSGTQDTQESGPAFGAQMLNGLGNGLTGAAGGGGKGLSGGGKGSNSASGVNASAANNLGDASSYLGSLGF